MTQRAWAKDSRAFIGRQFTDWACNVAGVNVADVAELSFGVRGGGIPFVLIYGRESAVLAVLDLGAERIGAGEVKAGTAR